MALYAALRQRGYFDEALLDTYGSLGSRLPGHPVMQKLPGVEANTGALGHGLSIAGGMAMGLKLKKSSARVYVIMGDGELAEGSNWEAAAAASHHKLDNLLVFVDRNGLQISAGVSDKLVLIIQGIIVLSVVIAYEVVRRAGLRMEQRRVARELAAQPKPAIEEVAA